MKPWFEGKNRLWFHRLAVHLTTPVYSSRRFLSSILIYLPLLFQHPPTLHPPPPHIWFIVCKNLISFRIPLLTKSLLFSEDNQTVRCACDFLSQISVTWMLSLVIKPLFLKTNSAFNLLTIRLISPKNVQSIFFLSAGFPFVLKNNHVPLFDSLYYSSPSNFHVLVIFSCVAGRLNHFIKY